MSVHLELHRKPRKAKTHINQCFLSRSHNQPWKIKIDCRWLRISAREAFMVLRRVELVTVKCWGEHRR